MAARLKQRLARYGRPAAICGLAVGAGWLAYKAYKHFTTDQPKVIFNPFREESRVDGSEETPRLEPKCQLKLGIEANGSIEVFGCGFRTNIGGRDYLATAGHNVAFGQGLYLVKGTNIALLKNFEVIQTAYDSCLIPVDVKVWTSLGVSVARFAAIGNSDLCVEIVGASGKGTTGRLKSSSLLGMVEYASTTLAGYSGAVYFNGTTVYGMHTLGGRANVGIAAMFLLHAFKIALRLSEELYDRSFYNRIMKQRTGHGNVVFLDDYAVVETQMGYFYRFPKADFLRYQNEQHENDYDDEESVKSDDFIPDEEPENIYGVPLNSLRPGHSRAGKSAKEAAVFTPREKQLIEMLLQKTRSRPVFVGSRKSKKGSEKSSGLPTPAAAPSLPASSNTLDVASKL